MRSLGKSSACSFFLSPLQNVKAANSFIVSAESTTSTTTSTTKPPYFVTLVDDNPELSSKTTASHEMQAQTGNLSESASSIFTSGKPSHFDAATTASEALAARSSSEALEARSASEALAAKSLLTEPTFASDSFAGSKRKYPSGTQRQRRIFLRSEPLTVTIALWTMKARTMTQVLI